MNFIGRHDHLSGYRRVESSSYGKPLLWTSQPYDRATFHPAAKYKRKTSVKSSRNRRGKGARLSTSNDWLRIKIGGDDTLKKKKKNKKLQTNRIKSTKYTLITFLPQNLIEQFRRIANFYFLVMTIISLLIDSPVSPMTSLLPLVFVIVVTATKQGCEDYLRYKTDNVVNCSPVTVIREGKECNIECQHIEPGDLVIVSRDCDVPCDLVLLKSSDLHGKCFVTTANLDGESNLKTLTIPRGLPNVEINQMHKLGVIECETPMTDLYSFNGKIELSISDPIELSQTPLDEGLLRVLPLTAENVLLRGSRVKNTECVIGCAVYTGMTTKLALNSRLTRNKSSSSEVYVNRFLIFILVALIFIVTFQYFMKRYNELFLVPKATYLGPASDSYSVKAFLQDYLSFLILYNYLIPISLYVTIEMFRVLGGFFMEWDLGLYDEPTDQHCIVNTSNLNEELGHINILFSDKTGTLTKNEMIFQQCSIDGKKFLYKKTKLQEESSGILLDINKFNVEQKIFFQGLAICHTVQVAGDTKDKEEEEPKREAKTKGYSISDITEESHDSSQQSDIDTSLSTNPNGRANGNGSVSDINPLLDETQKIEKRKRPEVVRRSPLFARPPTRIHPANNIEMMANGFPLRPVTFPANPQGTPNSRPGSLPFKRSTSEVDLQDPTAVQVQTHRRTQSYGAPSSYVTQPVTFMPLRRTPSTISRESYAMPNYISRQPSALIRAESVRRKNEIQNTVEMLDYQASSPDEKALVEACANLGLVFLGDDDEILKVRLCPPHMDYSRPFSSAKTNNMYYDRLHVLEFTSDRKRMSVIVKDENGAIWIYTKGAESYIFPLCATSSSCLIEKTDAHISDFAKQGLRTLAVARKRVTDEEYRIFLSDLSKANASLENRKQLSEECYAKIERDLDLLGATAVEDALQDDVADTLRSLQKAGIKIWVLTGDKVETALNIALSCGHIPADAMKYFIVDCTKKEDLEVHLNTLEREIIYGLGRPCALLIEGKSLTVALKELPDRFRDVTIRCEAVLCCRLSPLQKSEVVSLIKTSRYNYITAAIGDGANDVSMIQEAHVGVGIIGKEGRQAARCADFALARFNMLKRLLLLHGHYHTTRMSLLVLYFFYKNTLFMGVMFLFQFHCMFSSQPVYDSWFLTLYNVIYTSLPIFFISLTEKKYPGDELLSKPELYMKNINNKCLQWPCFLKWVLFAIYHCLVAFYFIFLVFSQNNILLNVGQTAEAAVFGTLLMQLVVIVVNLKLWLETKHHTYWYIVTIWGSIIAFMVTTVIYNVINLQYDADMYWSYNKLFCSIPLWLLTILTVVACLLPDYFIRVCKDAIHMPKRTFFPGSRNKRNKRLSKVDNTYL